jgi:antitoxin (DNA-binding transcriptional repressor) of toxin-antitoxin stability system
MRTVDLKTLESRLDECIRLVAGGETVLVTDHARVAAELVPPSAGRGVSAADAMLADADRGWLAPPAISGS